MEELTREQLSFLEAEGRVVVRACPGSGKTYSVAIKLLSYLDNWDRYHQGVAVLSFTNVASEEIYKKTLLLNKGIGKLNYPHYIGTVDSFINEFIVLRYGYLKTHDNVRPIIALSDNWKLYYGYWRTECYRKGCVDNIEKFQWGIDNKFYKEKEVVDCELHGKNPLLPCQQYKAMLMKKNIIFQNEVASFVYRLLKEYPMIATAMQEETLLMEDGSRRIVDLLVNFTKANPAIYVEKWEGQLAIEINDTHPVDSKKISQMKQKGLACLEFTVSKWNVRDNFNNAEDEEKQIIEITEKLDGKNGGYIRGELLVDPISRKYFGTKLYEDEKREKERVIAELNQVKQLYGQAIDTNKQLGEQIQLLDRNINAYKNKISSFEANLRVTEQENAEIKSSFWYKLFGKK